MSFNCPETNGMNRENKPSNKYLLSDQKAEAIISETVVFWRMTLSELFDKLSISTLVSTTDISRLDKTTFIDSRMSYVFAGNLALLLIQKPDAKQYADTLLNALKSGAVNYTNYKIVKDKERIAKKYYPDDLYHILFADSRLFKDVAYSFVYSPCLSLVPRKCDSEAIVHILDTLVTKLQKQFKTNKDFSLPESIFDVVAILHMIPEFKQAINYWYVRSPYVFDNLAYELIAHTEPFMYYMLNSQIQQIRERFSEYLDVYETKRLKMHFLLTYGLLRHRFQHSVISMLEAYVSSTESKTRLEILLTYANLVRSILDIVEQIVLTG